MNTSRLALVALATLAAALPAAADRRFTASDLPEAGIRKPGRIIIRNDESTITASRQHGNVQETLVSLRSTPVRSTPFGAVVFDGSRSAGPAVPAHLATWFEEAGRVHGVDPRLIAAVAARESSYRTAAVSPKGARGVMQLMPATAEFLGVHDAFDARQNIFGGTRYLRMLLDTFRGDLDLTLAAYNAGPGAVKRHRGVPPYAETRAYIAAVRGAYTRSLVTQ